MSATHCMSSMKLMNTSQSILSPSRTSTSQTQGMMITSIGSNWGKLELTHDPHGRHSRILVFAHKKNETEYRVRMTQLHQQLKFSQICYSSSGSSLVNRTMSVFAYAAHDVRPCLSFTDVLVYHRLSVKSPSPRSSSFFFCHKYTLRGVSWRPVLETTVGFQEYQSGSWFSDRATPESTEQKVIFSNF